MRSLIGCRSLIPILLLLMNYPACSLSNTINNNNNNGLTTTTEFTPTQYHIQTDDGDRRFFKYQTWSGQFRKENRLDDGSVVGSYGWVDANGLLRLYDYIADHQGYRILKTRLIKVGKQATEGDVEALIQKTSTTATPKRFEEPIDNSILEGATGQNNFAPRRGFVDHDILLSTNDVDASARLQRRILTGDGRTQTVDVQPLFDLSPEPEETDSTPNTEFSSNDERIATTATPFVARGERFRGSTFQPIVVVNDITNVDTFGGLNSPKYRGVARNRAEDGRQFVVVKRRRPTHRGFDYQTGRAFHHEELLTTDGHRDGQYGYIDPIGVRRVVNYSTGPDGEIVRTKENDFVGADTYFEAN